MEKFNYYLLNPVPFYQAVLSMKSTLIDIISISIDERGYVCVTFMIEPRMLFWLGVRFRANQSYE